MTALFALLAMLQADPARDKSGLFEFVRPAGWTAQDTPDGGRALLAPDGSGALVRFLRPESWAGTLEAYHEALHAVIRQGAPVRSGGRPAPFGAFLRSEAVVGAEGGPAIRLAMYTAKAGDQFQGLFFAAGSDDAFEKHRGAADGLVKAIALPGARERWGGLEFSMPTGWARQDDPGQGVAALRPGDLPAGDASCALVMCTAREFPGGAEELHDRSFAALTAGRTLLNAPAVSAKGLFRSTRVRAKNAEDKDAWLVLYTARRGAVTEALVFAATAERYDRHAAAVDALVAGITFPAAAPAPAAPGAKAPRPIPGRDVKLLGLWLNGATNLRYGMDAGGGFSARMRSSLHLLALWENGLAYRGVHNASIFTDNGLMNVPEGLAAVDAAAMVSQPKFEDTRFSRWTEKDGVVEIPGNWHGALRLTRDGAGFVAQDGAKWLPLGAVDGVVLDGTYAAVATAAAPEILLQFRKDGRFEQANLVHALGGPTNNPAFPVRGKGNYEFRKWSLILRFDGGYAQAIAFPADGEGLAGAKSFVLAGSEFVKR